MATSCPVVAHVRSPVPAVGEEPDRGGFGDEGGGGEIMDLPVGVEFYFVGASADTAAFCVPVISYPYRLLLLIQNLYQILQLLGISLQFGSCFSTSFH